MIDKFIPPFLHDVAWLAGGYAVDPETASDIDIWLCGVRPSQMQNVVEPLLTSFWDERGFNVELITPTYQHPAYPEADQFAHVYPRDGEREAHIMITDNDVQDVVNNFDLSIVQKAINIEGRIIYGTGYTSTFDPIVILHQRESSERRLMKYMKRFGLRQGV